MKSSSEFRAMARASLKDRWGEAALFTLVYLLIAGVCSIIDVVVERSDAGPSTMLTTLSLVWAVFLLLPTMFAFSNSLLRMNRSSERSLFAEWWSIFTQQYGRGLLSYLLLEVIVTLILLPFVLIGAVVAFCCCSDSAMLMDATSMDTISSTVTVVITIFATVGMIPALVYSYGVALFPYLMFDHPEMGAREAFKTSRRMMRGLKWKLFVLDLTFVGWAVLAVLTLGIGVLWLTPYQNSARAHFYDELKNEACDDCAADDSRQISAAD